MIAKIAERQFCRQLGSGVAAILQMIIPALQLKMTDNILLRTFYNCIYQNQFMTTACSINPKKNIFSYLWNGQSVVSDLPVCFSKVDFF